MKKKMFKKQRVSKRKKKNAGLLKSHMRRPVKKAERAEINTTIKREMSST